MDHSTTTASTTAGGAIAQRLAPLDAWRGLIMVLMALDHANALVARGKLDPEMWTTLFPDYRGDWLVFLTRWVTHLAAPGFFFLMGIGAILFARSRARAGWSQLRITTHLAARGALLIALQFLVENLAWGFGNAISGTTYVGVLYALGGSLIVASLLVRLNPAWLVAGGASILVLSEVVLPGPTPGFVEYPLWKLLLLWPGLGDGVFVLYPVVPWLGVTLLGMAYGVWLAQDRSRAFAAMLPIGAAALAGFVVVRLIDGFGNVLPRQTGDVIGVLNVVKYPPSIAFVLVTLGAGLVITWGFWRILERRPNSLRILIVYGRVPLFFYLAHLWLYAALGRLIDPDGIGSGPGLFLVWVMGLVVLYPACAWYGRFKQSRPTGSPWRFL